MAIRRGPGGVWRVEFQLGGLRVHRSARTRDCRAAEAFERKLRQEVFERRVLGAPRAAKTCTLGVAVDRYVTEHLEPAAKSPRTLRNELYLLGRLVQHLGGRSCDLREVDSGRVADLKRRLVASGPR